MRDLRFPAAAVVAPRSDLLPRPWFHGTDSTALLHDDQDWDRGLAAGFPNASGPGLYFTANGEEATGYGRSVYRARLLRSFRFLPPVRPTIAALRQLHAAATEEEQARFQLAWRGAPRDAALAAYLNQPTLHSAAIILYGELIRRPATWVAAMVGLGYDGILIRPGDKRAPREHLIVWNPGAMVFERIA